MNLFHEVENKYYELLTRLLMSEEPITDESIIKYWEKYSEGERDFEVENSIFTKKEETGTLFDYYDNEFVPILDTPYNIRMTKVELQAAKNLLISRYAKHFLSDGTYEKLKRVLKGVTDEWTISDILVRNQFGNGAAYINEGYETKISIIASAIKSKKSIIYDNCLAGKYEYLDKEFFPLKIEYSFMNDVFRICGFDSAQSRFIKLNLSSMSNIHSGEQQRDDLEAEYKSFLKENTKTIMLDVEPIDHVIERCFRIFSYYDRKAIFSKEEDKYKLEISYLKFDENEVIRDILSLGSSVVVIEPKRIQKQIYKRIVAAASKYEV